MDKPSKERLARVVRPLQRSMFFPLGPYEPKHFKGTGVSNTDDLQTNIPLAVRQNPQTLYTWLLRDFEYDLIRSAYPIQLFGALKLREYGANMVSAALRGASITRQNIPALGNLFEGCDLVSVASLDEVKHAYARACLVYDEPNERLYVRSAGYYVSGQGLTPITSIPNVHGFMTRLRALPRSLLPGAPMHVSQALLSEFVAQNDLTGNDFSFLRDPVYAAVSDSEYLTTLLILFQQAGAIQPSQQEKRMHTLMTMVWKKVKEKAETACCDEDYETLNQVLYLARGLMYHPDDKGIQADVAKLARSLSDEYDLMWYCLSLAMAALCLLMLMAFGFGLMALVSLAFPPAGAMIVFFLAMMASGAAGMSLTFGAFTGVFAVLLPLAALLGIGAYTGWVREPDLPEALGALKELQGLKGEDALVLKMETLKQNDRLERLVRLGIIGDQDPRALTQVERNALKSDVLHAGSTPYRFNK